MGTTRVDVWDRSGADTGYLRNRQHWWFDPAFPHAFELFDLDGFYEENYFRTDHVGPAAVQAYVDAVLAYGQRLTGAPIGEVLEAGCGGGWFTKGFLDRGLDVVAIEGTRAGIARTLARGVPADRLIRHDLRRPLALVRRFQVATCTEVAEHIECPFAGQLVQTLVDHADVIWFSFEAPGTNEAHYHHTNEQPARFWINLFAFHDYTAIEIPPAIRESTESRGSYIFCGPAIRIPTDLSQVAAPARVQPSAGAAMASATPKGARHWVRKIVPPIVVDAVRALRLRGRG
ncbi:MAG: hypothetical protein A3J29_03405 [Acidobacteria bacterium RIFCSPLOWO2_12_FULL_67_14b]|nr:MAG: hypothetical protein A3J29_03405 [Acidobacteria bacterium RIFCSPLOWO2_12_FULL_67_14b]